MLQAIREKETGDNFHYIFSLQRWVDHKMFA